MISKREFKVTCPKCLSVRQQPANEPCRSAGKTWQVALLGRNTSLTVPGPSVIWLISLNIYILNVWLTLLTTATNTHAHTHTYSHTHTCCQRDCNTNISPFWISDTVSCSFLQYWYTCTSCSFSLSPLSSRELTHILSGPHRSAFSLSPSSDNSQK